MLLKLCLRVLQIGFSFYGLRLSERLLSNGLSPTAGHIAHLNLTDDLLPYKKVIADVFLDVSKAFGLFLFLVVCSNFFSKVC